MKPLIILVLSFLTPSCGPGLGSDYAQFTAYVDYFVAEGAARGRVIDPFGLKIYLVDKLENEDNGVIGICYSGGYIYLKKSYWEKATLAGRETLIYHEMGHCLLDKDHSSCPNLMCPTVLDGDEFEQHRKQYLDVLFSR